MAAYELDHEIDLVEIIEAGCQAVYPNPKETFAAMRAAADYLHGTVMAGRILRLLVLNKEKVRAAGLCQDCGTELIEVREFQHHPIGNTVARETAVRMACPHCEV